MTAIGSFFLYALIVVFAQNLFLGGSVNTGAVLNAVRKPVRLWATAGFTSLFTLLCALSVLPFDRYLPMWAISSSLPVRAAAVALAAVMWYLIVSAVLARIPAVSEEVAGCASQGAFSGAALGAPLLLFNGAAAPFSLREGSITYMPSVLGYCLGAGLGFVLASWLLNAGMRRADNPDIPAALRGAPVMLIYIGLLALAFSF